MNNHHYDDDEFFDTRGGQSAFRRRGPPPPPPQSPFPFPAWTTTNDSRSNKNKSSHYFYPPQSSSTTQGLGQVKSVTLLSLLAASIVAVWYGTPVSDWITEIALLQVPIQADVDLGRKAAVNYPIIYDNYWSPKIETIGFELVDSLKDSPYHVGDYPWEFGIIQDKSVNAFCLPGGIVRVTSALLNQLQPTNGEMAALLGHEIGHVVQRHAQKRILSEQLLQYALRATVYEDNDDDKESWGQALGELMLGASDWLGQQHFSRRDEYQSDAVAWDLLVRSSSSSSSAHKRRSAYTPQSLMSLLEKLGRLEHPKEASSIPSVVEKLEAWSRTHPATQDRIQMLEQKWESLPLSERRRLARYPV